VVFTSGGTEAANLALRGAAHAKRATLPAGAAPPRVVVTAIEHSCVLDAATSLAREGFSVAKAAPTPDGRVEADAVDAAAGPGTAVASVMLANHETGAVLPVADAAARLRARGVVVHCDAALGPGQLDVSVEALGVDLLSTSAHKWNGPKGIGALYVRRRTRLAPQAFGGVQEDRVRPGTENVAGAVGLAAALERAAAAREERVARYGALRARLEAGIARITGCRVVGPERRLPSTVLAEFEGCEGESLLVNLDLEGIAVSTGSACAVGGVDPSPVLLAMGFSSRRAASTIRFSFGEGNVASDVDRVLDVLPPLVSRLRALAR
jgi:cysteine desulfurase